MPLLWRRKRGDRRDATRKKEAPKGVSRLDNKELTIPPHFRCPISLDLMKDPVSLSTGITYDRESIEKWMNAGHVTCPVTNQVLRNFDQIPNHALRKMIQDWCVENKSHGLERIPTPRIPISPFEVSQIRSRIMAAARSADEKSCLELLGKVKNLVKESERNKHCIVGNGIGAELANVFESFARASMDKHVSLLKETLSMLAWSFPLSQEGASKLESVASLRCIIWLLKRESNDLHTIQNTILVLKELVFEDQSAILGLMEIEGVENTLLQALNIVTPLGPKPTQACLMLIHQMVSQQGKTPTISKFVQLGLIPAILNILVDGNKGTSEVALGILDGICSLQQGKDAASANALTVPLIVKKILRVSDAATAFCIAILCKIGAGENEDALIEAVQLGAFQKLLVVLQVGCGEKTKERTTELLRLMNKYRNKLDCFDSSMGFKYIRRSN